MTNNYLLEKWVWTENDFHQMGWHDCHIHAIAFLPEQFEFVLDIDYIFQWVHPEPGDTYFSFWLAPATLVFENVYDLVFDTESNSGGLEIDGIERTDPRKPRNINDVDRSQEWLWNIKCQEGEIHFRSVGYKQYIKAEPILARRQILGHKGRGGISFARSRGG